MLWPWQCGHKRGGGAKSFPNNADGFAQFTAQLAYSALHGRETPIVLILEPTGGYEMALVAFAHGQGWPVCLPNPKQVRDCAKSDGRRAKTDAQDALPLAQFGAEQQPEPQAELPVQIQELI